MFLNVSDQVSHPYKSTGKIIGLIIIIIIIIIVIVVVVVIVVIVVIIIFLADDIKINQEITYPYDSWLHQSEINNIHVWCILDYMKLNKKTRVISFVKKQTGLVLIINCLNSITHMDCIRDLGGLTDTEIHFQQQVDNIFCQAIRLLGLIQTVTFSILSLHSLLTLCCTLVRPKLEYACVMWNSITSSGASKLENIQQKFVSLCHHRFISHLDYSYGNL